METAVIILGIAPYLKRQKSSHFLKLQLSLFLLIYEDRTLLSI